MNEIEFETMLYELLQDDEAAPEIARVQTFEEAGLLTNNRGVVVIPPTAARSRFAS